MGSPSLHGCGSGKSYLEREAEQRAVVGTARPGRSAAPAGEGQVPVRAQRPAELLLAEFSPRGRPLLLLLPRGRVCSVRWDPPAAGLTSSAEVGSVVSPPCSAIDPFLAVLISLA